MTMELEFFEQCPPRVAAIRLDCIGGSDREMAETLRAMPGVDEVVIHYAEARTVVINPDAEESLTLIAGWHDGSWLVSTPTDTAVTLEVLRDSTFQRRYRRVEPHIVIETMNVNADATHSSDPNDSRLTHGADAEPVGQADVYLVLSEEERAKGFVRPVRRTYIHGTRGDTRRVCGAATTMGQALAETYAREPKFYGATYCVRCQMHRPVGEFTWDDDGQVVGS